MSKKPGFGRSTKEQKELKKKRVNIRFTYDEYISIIKKKPSYLTDSAYFRELIFNTNVLVLDYNRLDSAVQDVRKIGVNINQIAKKVNSSGLLDVNDNFNLQSKISELVEIHYKFIDIITTK